MIVTNNKKLFEKCYLLRDHCRNKKKKDLFNKEFAFKYMPFNIQAALLCSQLEKIDQLIEKKKKIFFLYKKFLNNKNFNFNNFDKIIKNGCWATVLNIEMITNIKLKKIFKSLNLAGFFPRPFFYPISSLPAFKIKKLNQGKIYRKKTLFI